MSGFGNKFLSMTGGYYGVVYTIVLLLMGIILIAIGATLMNEKGYISVEGRLSTQFQNCRYKISSSRRTRTYMNNGYQYEIEYKDPVTNEWKNANLKSKCYSSEQINPNNVSVALQYNEKTGTVRHSIPSSAGLILIIFGVFLCILGIMTGICTMYEDCRMGLGAMGILGAMFNGGGSNYNYNNNNGLLNSLLI